MIGVALLAITKNSTAAQDVLADANGFRFFREVVPQKQQGLRQMPCAVYTTLNGRSSKTYCGTIPLLQSTIAIDYYGVAAADAIAAQRVVRQALLDFRGEAAGFLISDVTLTGTYSASDMEPGLFRLVDEFSIWFSQE